MDWRDELRDARNVLEHSCIIDLRVKQRNLRQHPDDSKKHMLAEGLYRWLEKNRVSESQEEEG